MNKLNPNNRERFIMLYADEFDVDVWEDYCEALGVSSNETEIRINCDYRDIVTGSEMSK